MDKAQIIESWIEFVTLERASLGGFPVCPYAKHSKYKIIECSIEDIEIHQDYDVVIYIVEDKLTQNGLKSWCNFYNTEHESYIFLDDHRDADTYIKNVKTGNGRYNLILCQSKAKLRRFREMLSKTDYYDYWDKSYLETILGEDIDVICQSTLG
jgi:hypothetical protein